MWKPGLPQKFRQAQRAGTEAAAVSGLMLELALDWLYPSNIYCACCGDTIDAGMPYSLCGRCLQALCWVGEEPDSGGAGGNDAHLFHRAFSCVRYDGNSKEILRRFKFGGRPDLGRPLGRLMLERIEREGVRPDLVVPVPMHRKKERIRGYNQAALLADVVREGLGLSRRSPPGRQTKSDREQDAGPGARSGGAGCVPDDFCGSAADNLGIFFPGRRASLLERVKETGSMSSLSRLERKLNLRDAFAVPSGREGALKGKRVLLVDDIVTTGTTADGCCQALLDAGAAEVSLLVFASGQTTGETSGQNQMSR